MEWGLEWLVPGRRRGPEPRDSLASPGSKAGLPNRRRGRSSALLCVASSKLGGG